MSQGKTSVLSRMIATSRSQRDEAKRRHDLAMQAHLESREHPPIHWGAERASMSASRKPR